MLQNSGRAGGRACSNLAAGHAGPELCRGIIVPRSELQVQQDAWSIIMNFLNLFPTPALCRSWRTWCMENRSMTCPSLEPLCWHCDSGTSAPAAPVPHKRLHRDGRWKMGIEPSRYFQISTAKQKQIPVPRKTFPIQHPGQSLPPRPPSSPAPARL